MIISVPINKIEPNPWNTRQGDPNPTYVESLADDIARNGLLQKPTGRLIRTGDPDTNAPVGAFDVVAMLENSVAHVELAFGHNRLAAFRLLAEQDAGKDEKVGYDLMPVDIQTFSDEQMALMAWSENEKRRDVTPIERAMAIQKRIEDFGWSQAQIAELLGISRPVVSNSLRLLSLPNEVQKALGEGSISERVAMALASLLALPESLRNKGGYSYSSDNIIRDTLAGKMTSDAIRQSIDRIVEYYGRLLDKAPFTLDQVFGISGIQSSTCRDCELRYKDRNICTDPDCYSLKKEWTERDYLARASRVCDILPIETPHGNLHEMTLFGRWDNGSYLDALLEAKCQNLRLFYSEDEPHDRDHDRILGFPHAQIVCLKRQQFCNCLKGAKFAAQKAVVAEPDPDKMDEIETEHPTSEPQTANADQLADYARQARQERREAQSEAKVLLHETAERIATGLAMRNKATWLELLNRIFYGSSEGLNNLWDIQVKLGEKIAERNLPYEIHSIDPVIKGMNEILAKCGLDLLDVPKEDLPILEDAEPIGRTLSEVFAEAES